MSRRIWGGVMARDLLDLAEVHYERGRDLDADLNSPDTLRSVEVASAVARVLGVYGVDLPVEDAPLLALLRRTGALAPSRAPWMVAQVAGTERAAVLAPMGAIESNGEQLALIARPEPDRYGAVYCLPGVWYMGVRPAAQDSGVASW